ASASTTAPRWRPLRPQDKASRRRPTPRRHRARLRRVIGGAVVGIISGPWRKLAPCLGGAGAVAPPPGEALPPVRPPPWPPLSARASGEPDEIGAAQVREIAPGLRDQGEPTRGLPYGHRGAAACPPNRGDSCSRARLPHATGAREVPVFLHQIHRDHAAAQKQ